MPKFSNALFDKVCERIAGGESVKTICADDDMPSQDSFYKWLREKPGLAERYTRAREAQADTIFDEILEIADDGRNDWMARKEGEDEIEVLNHEHVQRSRIRIDARKWMAGKLAPKKYGDKLTLDASDDLTDRFARAMSRDT